jgi:hypothetical protein
VLLNGRALVCGIKGYRFKSYYPPSLDIVRFFKKTKFKKKKFKINYILYKDIPLFSVSSLSIYMNIVNYKKFKSKVTQNILLSNYVPAYVSINQKIYNPKAVIHINKNLNTFSVGSIIKYFKVKQAKHTRRSYKGVRVFLNFLKKIFEKKYYHKNINTILFGITGIDYNMLFLKKDIKYFIKNDTFVNVFFLCNIKISFTKQKQKKVKSIKKR